MESMVMTGVLLFLLTVVDAEVRSSASYRLESDSINFGGGLASSTNYTLESTAGEVATGISDSASYSLRAGYQQMQEVFISLSDPGIVQLTPPIGGLTGGEANGSTTVLVITDSPSGYELSIVAENAPAMQKGVDTIADYTPVATPNADPSFITDATDVHLGYSIGGEDMSQHFRNNSSICGVGSNTDAEFCWEGLSTAPRVIAEGVANQPQGASTTIFFRVELGSNVAVPPGEYVATTTLTALPL
jgi:hypothetical protein